MSFHCAEQGDRCRRLDLGVRSPFAGPTGAGGLDVRTRLPGKAGPVATPAAPHNTDLQLSLDMSTAHT